MIRTLLDMSVADVNVKVECRWCGRWRIIESGRLMWRYQKKGWPLQVEKIGDHLRCGGCGRKDVTVSQTHADPTDMQPERLAPNGLRLIDGRDAPCPEGIDPSQWRKAGARERKRLLDRLR